MSALFYHRPMFYSIDHLAAKIDESDRVLTGLRSDLEDALRRAQRDASTASEDNVRQLREAVAFQTEWGERLRRFQAVW